ncbi:MAG: EamA family transporter [Lachnospiraceae bacterium]|nr:EamA family transporter [Lachnospiraceae bacterium]
MIKKSKNENSKSKISSMIFLHLTFFIYSLASVLSKRAGVEDVLSIKFLFFYGMVLVILMLYAVLWQQNLKRIPLVTAYANKAVTVIWGMIWGVLLWHEKISIKNIIGAVIIMLGVVLIATEEKE